MDPDPALSPTPTTTPFPPALVVYLDRGIALFNDGRFFEAHEAWEDGWRLAAGQDRRFLQGLIQVAAALVKWQRHQERGLDSLMASGSTKLEDFRVGRAGLDVAALLDDLASWLRGGRSADPPRIRPRAGER